MDKMKETFACFSVLFFCSRLTMASETFTVDCTKSVIMGKYGSSVVLPCWLTPKINAESLEIRWYRPDQFKSPVFFYQNYKILTDARSSLISSGPQSNGLKEGDVSLRLDNLSLSDIGIFYCYVSGDKSYDSESVALNLTALGSPLQISLELHHNSVKLSSLSCGWFPQPSLLWNSTNTPYNLQSTNYIEQENGLFCIYSGVIVSSSNPNAINCSVTLSKEEKRSMSIYVKAGLSADYCVVWKILFAVALLFVLALFSIGYFLYRKYKGYIVVKKPDECPMSDEQPQQSKVCIKANMVDLTKDQPANMDDLRKLAVTIMLDTTTCKKDYLRFNNKADIVRDIDEAATKYSGDGFPYDLCVRGRQTFSAGRVYWEVGLKQPNVPTKKSWLVGVAKASYTIRDKKSDLTPLNGFWFLCSDPENGLHVNTEPEISPLFNKTVESVGVLLDFDKNELSFYSATDGVHIFTMIIKFQEEVVPLFNPGLGDEAALRIITLG